MPIPHHPIMAILLCHAARWSLLVHRILQQKLWHVRAKMLSAGEKRIQTH
jgi:hypothetical protein